MISGSAMVRVRVVVSCCLRLSGCLFVVVLMEPVVLVPPFILRTCTLHGSSRTAFRAS